MKIAPSCSKFDGDKNRLALLAGSRRYLHL
jgi:hypothetical protein